MAVVTVSMGASFSGVTSSAFSAVSSVPISASAGFELVATAGLRVHSTVSIAAAAGFTGVASATLSAPSWQQVSASPSFVAAGRAGSLAVVQAVPVSASASFSAGGKASLAVAGVTGIAAYPSFTAKTWANLIASIEDDAMSLCGMVDVILSMWGILCRRQAPGYALTRALTDINHALQLVWNNAEGRTFWTNQTLTLTLAAAEDSQDLPDYIQNVTGPCRRGDNKQPLMPIGTIGELETFDDVYLEGISYDVPMAYHIDRGNQSGDDPSKCTIRLNQPVEETTDFLLEIVREAPRFQVSDLETCPVVPIPHRYIESLLLPIACYQASNYYLFRNEDRRESLKSEYLKAMMSLGLADPLPGDAGDNKPPAN